MIYALGLALAYKTNRALHVDELSLQPEAMSPELAPVAPVVESYREDV